MALASWQAAPDHPGLRTVVLGVPEAYIPHGKPEAILAELGLDAAGITAALGPVRGLLGLKQHPDDLAQTGEHPAARGERRLRSGRESGEIYRSRPAVGRGVKVLRRSISSR